MGCPNCTRKTLKVIPYPLSPGHNDFQVICQKCDWQDNMLCRNKIAAENRKSWWALESNMMKDRRDEAHKNSLPLIMLGTGYIANVSLIEFVNTTQVSLEISQDWWGCVDIWMSPKETKRLIETLQKQVQAAESRTITLNPMKDVEPGEYYEEDEN